MCDCSNTGLQITVIHSKLAEQNLLMFDQRLTVVGHNAWPLFLHKKKKVSFSHVHNVLLHKGSIYTYIYVSTGVYIFSFKWHNVYLYSSFFKFAFYVFLYV